LHSSARALASNEFIYNGPTSESIYSNVKGATSSNLPCLPYTYSNDASGTSGTARGSASVL
jgi:hypothetical protein